MTTLSSCRTAAPVERDVYCLWLRLVIVQAHRLLLSVVIAGLFTPVGSTIGHGLLLLIHIVGPLHLGLVVRLFDNRCPLGLCFPIIDWDNDGGCLVTGDNLV